jgi:hypothetical protein
MASYEVVTRVEEDEGPRGTKSLEYMLPHIQKGPAVQRCPGEFAQPRFLFQIPARCEFVANESRRKEGIVRTKNVRNELAVEEEPSLPLQ